MEDLNYEIASPAYVSKTQRVSAGQLFDTNIMCLDDSEPISDSSTRFAEQPKRARAFMLHAMYHSPLKSAKYISRQYIRCNR